MDSCQQASCAGPRAVRGGGCGRGCSRAPRVARSPRHARPGLRRLLPPPPRASLPSPVRARHRAAPRVPRHGHRAPRHRRVGRGAGDVAGDVVVVCQHRPGARDGGGGARRAARVPHHSAAEHTCCSLRRLQSGWSLILPTSFGCLHTVSSTAGALAKSSGLAICPPIVGTSMMRSRGSDITFSCLIAVV